MGVKGLAKFIGDHAARAVRTQEFDSFMGRVIAIDASNYLYQFMIAIRDGENFQNLTNEAGETTSHISGMLARTIRLLEHGIKPVYVFDGKPPTMKGGELIKRTEKRAKAEEELQEAIEKGEREEVKKFMGRTVRVTKQHNEEVKELIRLMGLPLVEAPCEAEAQCASLAKSGVVWATATEDADALAFGTPILIRHLNFADQKTRGTPILLFQLDILLEDLKLTMDQFIDFCILCGCDYSDTIRGIGPGTAYKLISAHKTIETALDNLDKKYVLPDNFPYQEARRLFKEHEVLNGEDVPKLVWREADEQALTELLVGKWNFNAARVQGYIQRLQKAKTKSAQTRLENFFGAPNLKVSTSTPLKAKAKAKVKTKAKASITIGSVKSETTDGFDAVKSSPAKAVTSKKTGGTKRKLARASVLSLKDLAKSEGPVTSPFGKSVDSDCVRHHDGLESEAISESCAAENSTIDGSSAAMTLGGNCPPDSDNPSRLKKQKVTSSSDDDE